MLQVPTVLIAGFEIRMYTRDERGHRPHVHVLGNSGEIVVLLSDPVCKRSKHSMELSEARRALRIVAEHRDELLSLWTKYNG